MLNFDNNPVIALSKLIQMRFEHLSEHFYHFATNIKLSGKHNKVIMLSSVAPNEGKTTTSLNLAYAFAKMGKKALVIDADLRNPSFYRNVRASARMTGLIHYLTTDHVTPSDVVYRTEVEGLFVLFCEQVVPNPVMLLESEEFAQLLESLKNYFDYIIIDTPPIGLVTDAIIIGDLVDGTVLVVASNQTKESLLSETIGQLQSLNAKFLGVFLNKYYEHDRKYRAYNQYGQTKKTPKPKRGIRLFSRNK